MRTPPDRRQQTVFFLLTMTTLTLFTGNARGADPATALDVVEAYPKSALITAILSKCGGDITIGSGGETMRVVGRPDLQYITTQTLATDFDRCGLTARDVEAARHKSHHNRAKSTIRRYRNAAPRLHYAHSVEQSRADSHWQTRTYVGSIERTLEIQRDTRALRLGITREQLDRMEGRSPRYHQGGFPGFNPEPETVREIGEQSSRLERERACHDTNILEATGRISNSSAISARRQLDC